MNKWPKIFGAAVAAFGLLGWNGNAAEAVKIRAGYLPSAEQVLYFIAKEKNFFQQNGTDVELFRFTNSAEGLAAVKAGKLDVGFFGTAAPLAFIAKGADFTIFGGGGGEGAALVTKPENADRFKDLKNLKGATIGVVRLATGDIVFRAALHESGVDWRKDVTFKEFDSPAVVLEALKKGSLDAGILWIPFYTLAEKQGLKIVKYSGELLKGHTCCRQTALSSEVKVNPEKFEKFLLGLLDAYRFYLNDRDETVNIVAKYIPIDKDVIREDLYGGHLQVSPDPFKKSVVQFWGFMKDANYIKSDENIDARINTGIYAEALAKLIKRDPQEELWRSLEKEFRNGEPELHIKTN
ncbi:MAG: ABC transporter substrate-binding protein [Lentisphaerota bacterium]